MDDWVLLAAWVCETGHSITDWIGELFHQYCSLIGIEIGRQKTDQVREQGVHGGLRLWYHQTPSHSLRQNE